MNDEVKLQNEVSKGTDAGRLLDDPIFNETFDFLKNTYRAAWEQTSIEDSQRRENLWLMYKTADTLKSHIQSYVNTGKLAKKQIEEINGERKNSIW